MLDTPALERRGLAVRKPGSVDDSVLLTSRTTIPTAVRGRLLLNGRGDNRWYMAYPRILKLVVTSSSGANIFINNNHFILPTNKIVAEVSS